MTGQLIGCCGLLCSRCPAFLATQANDVAKAEETARLWAREYGLEVAVEQVWCDGCTGDGRKCAHCAECEIRSCALDRNLESCAGCLDYPCAQLTGFFEVVPVARQTLEWLRARA